MEDQTLNTTPGAEASEGAPAPQAFEELKNLKAEFGRKLSNTESALAEIRKQNELLAQQLQAASRPATEAKKLSDVLYENPEKYAEIVKNQAQEEAMKAMAAQQAQQAKQQARVQAIVAEYPELMQTDHALTKRALEIYAQMPDEDKASPVAYQAAVTSAALETGVRPKSKRQASEDDTFSLSGGGSGGKAPSRTPPKVDPRTLEFARSIGIDITDKAVLERMANNHGRKSYGAWE